MAVIQNQIIDIYHSQAIFGVKFDKYVQQKKLSFWNGWKYKNVTIETLYEIFWQDLIWGKWYFVICTKIILAYCEKNCSRDWENFWNLRLKAENFQKNFNH